MLSVTSKRKQRGFTAAELMISIGLAAVLAAGAIIGLRKFAAVHEIELVKSDLLNRHRGAQFTIADDLKEAVKLRGSTSPGSAPTGSACTAGSNVVNNTIGFFPVARIPSSPNKIFNRDDSFDGLTIFKSEYPEFWGKATVVEPVSGQSYFNVYYILENPDQQTDRDLFFQTAVLKSKYFYLSNNACINIIENLNYRQSDNLPVPETCPPCAFGNCPSRKCYAFKGGYRDTNGNIISNPATILDFSQANRLDTNIRVAERITYEVGGNCGAGVLCRTVNASYSKPIIDHLTQFYVKYRFTDPVTSMGTSSVKPLSAPIRSPADSDYLASLGNATPATYNEVYNLSLEIKETLPHQLAETITADTKGQAFEYQDGVYTYKSAITLKPGVGIEGDSTANMSNDFDSNCPTLQESQCKPGGVCNYLFTNTDPTAPNWIGYQYDVKNPSDRCVCGWNPNDNRFYDMKVSDNQLRMPFLNQTIYDIYKSSTPANNGPVDHDRAMACGRYFACGDNYTNYFLESRNPVCVLVRNCIQPSARALVWSKDKGFDENLLLSWITASSPSPSKLSCLNNTERHFCDDVVSLWQDTRPRTSGASTAYQNFCACTVREYRQYNSDGTPNIWSAVSLSASQMDWDSLCRVPGATKQCTNTWDSDLRAWVLQDSAHPQGLPLPLAQLCSCRKNPKPDGNDTLSSEIDSVATNMVSFQYGHNDIQSGTGWGGWGWWGVADWQYRFSNQYFDFRVDSSKASPPPTPNAYDSMPQPLSPPDPTDKTGSYWFACGRSYNDVGSTKPKCLSTKSQWSRARVVSGNTVISNDIDCSAVQANYMRGSGRSPGACLASSHVEAAPAGWPAIGSDDPLYEYRFYCDANCGAGPYNDFSYQFTNEVNYIRSLIRFRAGEADKWAAWCPDLSWKPLPPTGGGNSSNSYPPVLGGDK